LISRDYSQALDVGTFSRGLDSPTIRILVWVLGFMSFGYATGEFEVCSRRFKNSQQVTEERLGVYRPEEHIDNPKDYADNIDARQYDPRLRGPVDPMEIQVDLRTGMKNYIANDNGNWMTSTRYIRDSLLKAIQLGRAAATDAERYEALRLLGQVQQLKY
jgi:Heterokaryon incompatibility protein Het-C